MRPGVPAESAETIRPDQQLDFHLLYKQNCAGCHGDNGTQRRRHPARTIPPTSPSQAHKTFVRTTAKGVPGTLMPAFAQSPAACSQIQQVDALVQGMIHEWSRPSDFSGVALPPYAATAPGNAKNGQTAYMAACARCHGADGTGVRVPGQTETGQQVETPHSIVDPSYLTLVSDQNLRSIVIAGHIDANAPDWRSYISGRALAPQEITDIVAWLASHRAPVAQQSVANPRVAPPGVPKKEKP